MSSQSSDVAPRKSEDKEAFGQNNPFAQFAHMSTDPSDHAFMSSHVFSGVRQSLLDSPASQTSAPSFNLFGLMTPRPSVDLPSKQT
eukprot:gene15562-21657_t